MIVLLVLNDGGLLQRERNQARVIDVVSHLLVIHKYWSDRLWGKEAHGHRQTLQT